MIVCSTVGFKVAVTVGLAGLLAGVAVVPSSADSSSPIVNMVGASKANNVGVDPCNKVPTSLSGYGPGDLIAATALPTNPALITGAKAWRILYVSSGTSEKNLEPVCGTVVMPDIPAKVKPTVVAWAHGTTGVNESCLPASNPDKYIFGPTPGGIGAVSYGSGSGAVKGSASNGILQSLINDGRVVVASDYYAGLGKPASVKAHYALGFPAGAAVLDSVRAGVALAVVQTGAVVSNATAWDVLAFGHSQGGHAALWAGQLGRSYWANTSPKLVPNPNLNLVGVIGLAPATSFVAPKGTSLFSPMVGRHLADLEMHQSAADIFDVSIGNVGSLLFSLVVKTWDQYGSLPVSAGASFVGKPVSVAGVRPKADKVVTTVVNSGKLYNGKVAMDVITSYCLLKGQGVLEAAVATQPFTRPASNAFFVQPLWGRPNARGVYVGGFDKTCLTTLKTDFKTWCDWMRFNVPGPEGTSGFAKVPTSKTGASVPVMVAQGMNDTIIHCVSASNGKVPAPADCLSSQYVAAMAKTYCPSGNYNGHVELNTWQKATASAITKGSPATHMSIPGQAADNGFGGFVGSREDVFMKAAFNHTLYAGCSAAVVNK